MIPSVMLFQFPWGDAGDNINGSIVAEGMVVLTLLLIRRQWATQPQ